MQNINCIDLKDPALNIKKNILSAYSNSEVTIFLLHIFVTYNIQYKWYHFCGFVIDHKIQPANWKSSMTSANMIHRNGSTWTLSYWWDCIFLLFCKILWPDISNAFAWYDIISSYIFVPYARIIRAYLLLVTLFRLSIKLLISLVTIKASSLIYK